MKKDKNVQSVMYDKEEKIFKMWYTYHITDKDMLPPGKKLEINANSLKGLIKVEVTDSIGQPIEGFNVMDCEEIRRNEFRIPVEWKSGKKLEDIPGQRIRLRFYMSQSKLYSFKFSN